MGVQNWFLLTQSWHPAHFFQPINVASLRIIGRIGALKTWDCSTDSVCLLCTRMVLGEELGIMYMMFYSSYLILIHSNSIYPIYKWTFVKACWISPMHIKRFFKLCRKGVFCEDLWQWKCCHHFWVIWMPLFCNRLDLGTFHPGEVHHVLTAMLVDIATSLIPSVAPPWIRGLTWKNDVASPHNGPGVDH